MLRLLFVLLSVSVVIPPIPDPLFTDADGDGYKGIVEVKWGCDQFDGQSFPYCAEWDTSTVVTCEPVSELIPLVPCEL